MDVNGTRFHLLLTKDDWVGKGDKAPFVSNSSLSPEPDLVWDETRASLSLRPLLFRFPTPPGDQLPRPQDRRGAGRDRYGNWYWIAESGTEILFLPVDGRRPEHFWSAEDLARMCKSEDKGGVFRPVTTPSLPESLRLSGLAVTERHYLVVGVIGPKGLLIFDLHAGGPPIQMLWPHQVPFAPFDMAPAPGGGVWILDREERRYWALDPYFRVVTIGQSEAEIEPSDKDDFQPETGVPRERLRRSFPEGISLDMASPVEALYPLSIEALPDGTVLILESDLTLGFSTIYRYHFGRQLGRASLEHELEGFLDVKPSLENPNRYRLLGHDMAFVPDPGRGDRPIAPTASCLCKPGGATGTLYIVVSDGNQSFAFDLKADDMGLSLELLTMYFPMRLFSGKALVAAGQAVYYDLQDRWVPLVEQPRPRYRAEGTLETRTFDGKEPNCVWHRLFLDACAPLGTEVLVESRAANKEDLLARMPWQEEPRPYRRAKGPELPYYQPFSRDERRQDGTGTWELLFQRAQGRYLQLRLTLRGTGRSTPRLRALRVYYPRFSYLKEYLPAVYQDDETSASFSERFLANVEGFYTVLEGKIVQVQALFDTRTTAVEYLDWLAGWFGVVLDPDWKEARRRLFLSHALELFGQRGTLAGLIRAVRLAIDPCPDDTLFGGDVLDCINQDKNSCTSSTQIVRYSVRIVERFLTRSVPGVVYGDPGQIEGPGVTTGISKWTPDQGAEPLRKRYRDYLKEQYKDIDTLNGAWGMKYKDFPEILLPPIQPSNSAEAKDWQRFLQIGLGFTYAAVNTSHLKAYENFLARRYQYVERLNRAYQLTGGSALASFEQVKLPGEGDMPSGGRRLFDWIQFVSLVLPITLSAHLFTVLVPTNPQSDLVTQERELDLVRRIVELEKPAHTNFEVKQYWALFRVGEARLGLDTLLDIGSRFVALVLGKNYIAESYLAPSHPWDVSARIVAGRDQIDSGLVM